MTPRMLQQKIVATIDCQVQVSGLLDVDVGGAPPPPPALAAWGEASAVCSVHPVPSQ